VESDHNAAAVKAPAKFAEVRHADDSDAGIYYMDPDSEELESRTDYSIHITSREGVRHLGNLFEALWEESIPIGEQLERTERPQDGPSKAPG
jgi:hypothetical protein